jgi:hypothetical protein
MSREKKRERERERERENPIFENNKYCLNNII